MLSRHFVERPSKIILEVVLRGHLLWAPSQELSVCPVLWNAFKTAALEKGLEPERRVMLLHQPLSRLRFKLGSG